MTKAFSVILATGAICATVFFGGRQAVFSTNNHSSAAAVSPTSLQSLRGLYLKKEGRSDWTRKLGGNTSTDLNGKFPADLSVRIYPKEGSRSADLITITELEPMEHAPDKGKFCAVYAGIVERTSSGRITGGRGTYYDNDGGSGEFNLSTTP